MGEEWFGLDTIRGLVGEPPAEVKIPYKVVRKQHLLLQEWNSFYIAIIPYCFKCKEILVWHHKPNDGVLFHCPRCNRKWTKDDNWDKEKEKWIKSR